MRKDRGKGKAGNEAEKVEEPGKVPPTVVYNITVGQPSSVLPKKPEADQEGTAAEESKEKAIIPQVDRGEVVLPDEASPHAELVKKKIADLQGKIGADSQLGRPDLTASLVDEAHIERDTLRAGLGFTNHPNKWRTTQGEGALFHNGKVQYKDAMGFGSNTLVTSNETSFDAAFSLALEKIMLPDYGPRMLEDPWFSHSLGTGNPDFEKVKIVTDEYANPNHYLGASGTRKTTGIGFPETQMIIVRLCELIRRSLQRIYETSGTTSSRIKKLKSSQLRWLCWVCEEQMRLFNDANNPKRRVYSIFNGYRLLRLIDRLMIARAFMLGNAADENLHLLLGEKESESNQEISKPKRKKSKKQSSFQRMQTDMEKVRDYSEIFVTRALQVEVNDDLSQVLKRAIGSISDYALSRVEVICKGLRHAICNIDPKTNIDLLILGELVASVNGSWKSKFDKVCQDPQFSRHRRYLSSLAPFEAIIAELLYLGRDAYSSSNTSRRGTPIKAEDFVREKPEFLSSPDAKDWLYKRLRKNFKELLGQLIEKSEDSAFAKAKFRKRFKEIHEQIDGVLLDLAGEIQNVYGKLYDSLCTAIISVINLSEKREGNVITALVMANIMVPIVEEFQQDCKETSDVLYRIQELIRDILKDPFRNEINFLNSAISLNELKLLDNVSSTCSSQLREDIQGLEETLGLIKWNTREDVIRWEAKEAVERIKSLKSTTVLLLEERMKTAEGSLLEGYKAKILRLQQKDGFGIDWIKLDSYPRRLFRQERVKISSDIMDVHKSLLAAGVQLSPEQSQALVKRLRSGGCSQFS